MGDICFKTTDRVVIRTSSSILKQASSVFADMFDLPNSGGDGTELKPIQLYTSSTAFEILLDISYHLYANTPRKWLEYEMNALVSSLKFAESSFFTETVQDCLRDAAMSTRYDPYKAFFVFSSLVNTYQQNTLALRTLCRGFLTVERIPEMEHCTAADYRSLIDLQENIKCQVCRQFERFPNVCKFQMKKCRECKNQVPWADDFFEACLRKLNRQFDREVVNSCFTAASIVASLDDIDCFSCWKGFQAASHRFDTLKMEVERLMSA